MRKKSLMIKTAAVLLLFLIAVLLYDQGKTHTYLMDNKDITVNGKDYKALKNASYRFDRKEAEEIFPRDRLMVEAQGRSHRIQLTVEKGGGNLAKIENKFKITHNQHMYIISLPVLASGDEGWLQVFEPPSLP